MTDDPLSPDFDPELWITADGYDGRLYLLGNAHTHLGRMAAWSETLKVSTTVSKYAVTDASNASLRWIDGFLRGNEPGPAEYLGIDELAEAELLSDDPAYARWQAGLAEFYRTGTMPPLASVPSIPFAEDTMLGHVPWVWAGGRSGSGETARGSWPTRSRASSANSWPGPFVPPAAITRWMEATSAITGASNAERRSSSSVERFFAWLTPFTCP